MSWSFWSKNVMEGLNRTIRLANSSLRLNDMWKFRPIRFERLARYQIDLRERGKGISKRVDYLFWLVRSLLYIMRKLGSQTYTHTHTHKHTHTRTNTHNDLLQHVNVKLSSFIRRLFLNSFSSEIIGSVI